jgi:hypothetical protein
VSVHRINAAVDSILKNNFIETLQDEGNFEKQVLIENIKYIDYNEIQIIVTLCYLSFFCLNKVSVHPLKAVNKIHPII